MLQGLGEGCVSDARLLQQPVFKVINYQQNGRSMSTADGLQGVSELMACGSLNAGGILAGYEVMFLEGRQKSQLDKFVRGISVDCDDFG